MKMSPGISGKQVEDHHIQIRIEKHQDLLCRRRRRTRKLPTEDQSNISHQTYSFIV